jgi:hypothetical protein
MCAPDEAEKRMEKQCSAAASGPKAKGGERDKRRPLCDLSASSNSRAACCTKTLLSFGAQEKSDYATHAFEEK